MGWAGSVWILAFLIAGTTAAAGADGDIRNVGWSEAAASGHPILELRPRYNHLDESDKAEISRGLTLRAIAGWRTAPWHGARVTVEAIHAGPVGRKRFNDDPATFATSPYPLLPDPRHTGLNQAFVDLGPAQEARVRIGRQRVALEDGRWVSDNDFRQVPQLFDGVQLMYTGLPDTQLTAAHFRRLRSTSGTTHALALTLLHAAWSPLPGHALSAYGYFHDQPRSVAFTGFADNSYRVHGVRASGAIAVAGAHATYHLEGARQRAFAGGDPRIDAPYWRAALGFSGAGWDVRLDRETKGSNAGLYGVQMPLTDFYAFNGWSLRFFNTPPEGLRDLWLTLRMSRAAVTLFAELHRFRSDHGSRDLGRETDIGVTLQLAAGASLRLQHADYRPGDAGARIRKTWLTLLYTY